MDGDLKVHLPECMSLLPSIAFRRHRTFLPGQKIASYLAGRPIEVAFEAVPVPDSAEAGAQRALYDDPTPAKQPKKCTASSSKRSPNLSRAKPTKKRKKIVTPRKTFRVQSRSGSYVADGKS